MARLQIRLLGPFEALLDGNPIVAFESDKVRALLIYLAAEADRPHRRERLAGLLWPDRRESAARNNLSSALVNLRHLLGDKDHREPHLHVTRQEIQFNRESDTWVDLHAFDDLTAGGEIRGRTALQLEDALALLRGEFLEGFSLRDSPEFEEWLLLQSQDLSRVRNSILRRLADTYQARGSYEAARGYAWQQTAVDPLDEGARQQLMQLLALAGQRSTALAQYESFQQLLSDELGIEPSAETRRLYRQILSGEIGPGEDAKGDRIIRGYDLLKKIGEGGFGVVYRAFQPVLGRDVAIKVIRPEYANKPEFVRRFEAEAQVVARLEHLHIVPLYDYWREPERAYLVTRLFPAGSLAGAMSQGPWQPKSAARVLDQVSSALAAAHSLGVIHGDVKPANILMDEGGNAYLADFGIARDITALADRFAAPGLSVSPEYASPEQWMGAPLTTAADLYSLGVVLYELLTGVHPFSGATPGELRDRHLYQSLPPVTALRPELPAKVDAVVARATAKSPRERYPDVRTMAEAFRQSVEPGVGPLQPAAEIPRPEPRNPYKGLQPFQEADAELFFGRDTLVQKLLTRMAVEDPLSRFLAVVGPSGSGKSSLVRAGLIPALRRGAIRGSESWFVADMVPGVHPLQELEMALLSVALHEPANLSDELRREHPDLLRAIEAALPESDAGPAELFLVIDQFEELYAQEVEATEREQFLQLLYGAVAAPGGCLKVAVTLRADYYDRPLAHPQLGLLMRERTEVVLPLTSGELAEAIREPAGRVGVSLEEGLEAAIVADVAEQPGALPMLQYALTELFERRHDRVLTWEAYRTIGGVSGALARRAEEVYAGLGDAGQALAHQIFLRLVTLGDGDEPARRRVFRKELMALQPRGPGQPEGTAIAEVSEKVLDALGRARLLLFDRDPATRAPTAELTHEALLRVWARLRGWIEDCRADVRMQRLLAVATAEWIEAGRDPGYLLRDTRLAQFEGWAADSGLALTRDERAFLEASVAGRQAQDAEREALRQRELETAQRLAMAEKARAEEQTQAAHRLRGRALQLAGLFLVALLLAVIAVVSWRQARDSYNLAATSEAQAVANAHQAATDQALAITSEAWAMSNANAAATSESLAQRNAEEAESEAASRATAEAAALQESQLAQQRERIANSRALAANALIATGADPELGVLLALEALSEAVTKEAENALHSTLPAMRLLQTFPRHRNQITQLSIDPAHLRLVTLGRDEVVKVWDLASGQELLSFDQPAIPAAAAISADGSHLAIGSGGGALRVWRLSSDEPLQAQQVYSITAHADIIHDAAFSPDGSVLATASADATAKIWDLASGQELLTLSGHATGTSDSKPPLLGVTRLAFGPDGAWLATAGADATVRLWDLTTGDELLALADYGGGVIGLDLSDDGTRLATVSEDALVKVWDLDPTIPQAQLRFAINRRSDNLDMTPDGTRLAVATTEGVVVMLGSVRGRELLTLSTHPGRWDVTFTPDSWGLVTSGEDGVARLWDVSPSRELLALLHTDCGVDFSADGTLLATGVSGGAIVWDVEASIASTLGQQVSSMEGHNNRVREVAFSPSDLQLATAGQDGTVRLWDTRSGGELLALAAHEGEVRDVVFSPSGSLLASVGSDAQAKIWDPSSGELLLELAGHSDEVWGVAFHPDETVLATVSGDRTLVVWDLALALTRAETGGVSAVGREATDQPSDLVLFTLALDSVGFDVAFSPDGAWLATGTRNGTVTTWDVSAALSSGQATGAGPERIEPKQLYQLPGHNWRITRLAFSPDGTRLAAAASDGSARIYDARLGEEQLILALHDNLLTGVAFSPDGKRLATSAGDGTTKLYALDLAELKALARRRLTRSLTEDECRRYLDWRTCPLPH